MARPVRIERVECWYHVTARGIDRRPIYLNDRDRFHWLELLAEAVETYRLALHAYVMMDNHYHLLIELRETNLSRAMQWFQTSYGMWFNRKHERVGPLFQGRYKAILVDPVGWGLELSRYIHLNPVRVKSLALGKLEQAAGRVAAGEKPSNEIVQERLEKLRKYRWSSYRSYVGRQRVPGWLTIGSVLDLGGKRELVVQQREYSRFVEQAVRQGLEPRPWEQLIGQLLLGGKEWLASMRIRPTGSKREQPQLKKIEGRPSWEELSERVSQIRGQTWEEVRGRRGDWGRDLMWYLGRKIGGMKLGELGERSGGVDYATVSAGIKRIERRLATDTRLRQQVQAGMDSSRSQ